MDGVGTPIIGRPRPLPGHDTPNHARHPHTLNYEEPLYIADCACPLNYGLYILLHCEPPRCSPTKNNQATLPTHI